MAQLASFATTASNVVTDADTRTITISNEVVEIDGVLDPPTGSTDNWGGWTIVCTSGGGFRSVAGASGTLGGGVQSLKIIEESGAFRYRSNNYQNGTGTYRARFAGDTTNNLKVHNVYWLIQSASGNDGRSDFDIYRGSNSNGSVGPNIEFSGVFVHQLTQSGVQPNHNHMAGRYNIVNHPRVGYGLRVRNETTAHVIEFTTPIQSGKKVEGLIVDNVASPTNHAGDSNARVTVQLNVVPTNGVFTLADLNAPSITDVSGSSDKTLRLIDPVGQPTITNNWGRHVQMEIQRTVPFAFTGADPNGATMNAIAQTASGTNSTATMSGTSGSIVVRTQYASNSALTWTNQNTYQYFMSGLSFRKYTQTTTQTIGNTPSTVTAALIADALPDGTAISTITSPTAANPPDTLSELIRAIKDWEVANPTFAPNTPLAWVDGNSLKINTGYGIEIDANATTLIEIGAHLLHGNEVVVKCGTTMSASNGLTTIDATGTGRLVRVDGVTEDNDVFLLDSSGQKTNVTITNNLGASALFSLVRVSNGTTTGSATIANAGTGTISVATKGLGSGYRVVAKRPGYQYYSASVDLTGGGLRTLTAPVQAQIVQPSGTASYVSSVTVPDTLTVAITSSGTTPAARIECGDATFSARQIFKAFEDEVASADGARYMGLGGSQVIYVSSALKGDEVILGTHTKVKRKASTDSNATIRATLYAPDDTPVDSANGDVQTIEGLNIPAVSDSIWSATTRTLTSASSSAPTAAQNAAAVWSAATRSLTSAAGLTSAQATQLATINSTITDANNGLAAIATAVDAIPTDTGASGGPTVIYSNQGTISPTAYDSTTKRFTLTATDYAVYAGQPQYPPYAVFTDLSTYTGATVGTSYYIVPVSSQNNQIVISTSTSSSNAISLTGTGTIGDVKIKSAQVGVPSTYDRSTAYAAPFSTAAWQLKNKSTAYFKLDAGHTFGERTNRSSGLVTYGMALQVSYSDTETGTYSTWEDVEGLTSDPAITLSNNKGFYGWMRAFQNSDDRRISGSVSFSNIYPLSILPSAITNDKWVKFRLTYFRWHTDNNTYSPDWIGDAYLNLTILPSLGVQIGGASSGGLNSVQATNLTNVTNAVTSATHGNAALLTAVQGVPADVWEVDLSATQTDNTAGDLVKEASTNSGGGGGGGGATAAQIWSYAIPASPTSGTAADLLKGAHDDASAAKTDLENSTDGLGALSSAIATVDSNVDSIKADIEDADHGLPALESDIANISVSGVPTAAENATAVWDKALSTDVVSNTTIAPLGLNAGFLTFSDGDYAGFPDSATQITITEDGGVSGYSDGDTYWAGKLAGGGLNYILLFNTEALARDPGVNAGSAVGPGTGGSVTDIRMRWSTTTTVNHGAAKSVLTDIDVPTSGEVATATWAATTRTLTASSDPSASAIADAVWEHADVPAAAATVGEIADAVWGENLSVTQVLITPTAAIRDNVGVPISLATYTELQRGDAVVVNNTGGFTGLTTGMTVYVEPQTVDVNNNPVYFVLLHREPALGSFITLTGGNYSQLRLSRNARDYGVTARMLRNITDEVEDINTAVDALPTASTIADTVWQEIIDNEILDTLTVSPTAEAGNGFRIPAADFALLTSGDDCTLTNVGGYSGLALSTTYYIYKGTQNEIWLYANRTDSIAGNANYVNDGGDGTATSVVMAFPETSPTGTAGVALRRIREAVADLDTAQTAHASATAAIGTLMNQLLGVNYIESGLSLQQAIQIITGVLAGRLSVENNGSTMIFHRLDSASTAVIRADVSAAGRTNPIRDPD